MKTKNTPLFIARLALTLFVICAVVAILLALVNRGRRDAQQQLPRLLEFLESNR